MEQKNKEGLSYKKEANFQEWYPEVVLKGELADYSPVKGCIIIKPRGYFIWEKIQEYFNNRIKKIGVKNAYFPLFIPESFFKKETQHAKGFSPEVAWVANISDEERLAIRPTSETIMYDAYSRWIRSYRDLPLRLNQWANVVRWETKQTRLFIRGREFLWQEGHCVYETQQECDKEAHLFLEEYQRLCKEVLAVPVIMGKKTESEKFAGALYTLSIEAIMPDGRTLQCGTTHNLGQGFAKSFGISYLGKDGKNYLPWQNSWGFSTRLIGACVMIHSDNKGLVLPPEICDNKLVIVPVIFEKQKKQILDACNKLLKELKIHNPILDQREGYTSGYKFNDWELKGIPIRIELGPKDLEKKQVVLVRRDTNKKEEVKLKDIKNKISDILKQMQRDMYVKANQEMQKRIVEVKDVETFRLEIENKKAVMASFCESSKCEEDVKVKYSGVKAIFSPFDYKKVSGKCIFCGNSAHNKVLFAKTF